MSDSRRLKHGGHTELKPYEPPPPHVLAERFRFVDIQAFYLTLSDIIEDAYQKASDEERAKFDAFRETVGFLFRKRER